MSEEPRFTRVDLFEMSGGVRVFWYPKGWHRGTVPATNHLNKDIPLDQMVAWLEDNGWTVRKWPKGARGWLGDLRPIRTRSEIMRKRSQLQKYPPPELEGIVHTLELALDY